MTERRLVVIAGPGLSAGFSLAGVRVLEATDAAHAAQRLDKLIADEHAGVVIIEESLHENLPDETNRALRRASFPVVIPVPGPRWTTESSAHEYIVEILRRAIGYRVRLQ
jgi:vacuolar-type H+-ATPase subunit F/Vma7